MNQVHSKLKLKETNCVCLQVAHQTSWVLWLFNTCPFVHFTLLFSTGILKKQSFNQVYCWNLISPVVPGVIKYSKFTLHLNYCLLVLPGELSS